MKKSLIAGLLVAVVATPALAAAQYYVAQNNSTHKCSVVSHKPDGIQADPAWLRRLQVQVASPRCVEGNVRV